MTTSDTQDLLNDDENSSSNDETNSSSNAVNPQESENIILNGASISSTSENSISNEDSTTSTNNTSETTENTIQPRDAQMTSAATIVFPTYTVSTTTTGASWTTLNNATQSGYAIKYNGGANYGTDGNYQFYIGESAGTNAGNAIYDTQSRNFAITGNAGVHLGRGNIFIVGSTVAANLTIATPTTTAKKTSASLTLASGSYLSVNGYLGATTSTAVAGFVSAADQVSIKVVSSFFTVGPTTGTIINPKFGNNTVMEIGGTFGVYQNASANIGSSFTLSAGALEVGANNGNITIDNDANIQLSGAGLLLNGSSTNITFGDNLALSTTTMSFGSKTGRGVQANATLSTGINANIIVNSGVTNTLSNGNVQFGVSANVHFLAGDLALGGAGVGVVANRNFFHMGDNNTLTLDAGSIVITNGRQTFDWGINGTINANSLSFAGTNQVFSMGTGANVGLTGGILVNATSTVLTFLDNTTMNLGSGGLTFNQSASFTLGNGGSFATTGDVTFASTAGGTIFNVGNVKTFTAGNVIINAAKPTITFGTSINYAVTGWQLNAANDTVKLGAGATGNIGNITFGANATGSLFDTGVANNLVFGNATLVQNATLTLNGTVTGTSLNLSNAAVVNIPAGANVNISSLMINGSSGTQQVVINVADGATFKVDTLSTLNVASTNIPKIVINGAGSVIIDDKFLNASNTASYEVQFVGTNGIYDYEGNIQELSGKLTITNFALTDQAIFEVGTAYTDQSRYVTSVVGGVLYVNYVDAATGALTEVAHFNYTPATTGQTAPNVLIVKNDASSTGYDIVITKCFLTGTHILTPEGEVTVENLKAGDSVITLQNGQQVSKQIVWAGNMNVSVNNYEHKDALYPVRIKAHAFGLNQPCRDLLVTPEHTIYVDGGLVPARMLVNGRSIITDTSMDSFTVYHIETEEHSILLSENLTTESYLNTDDRHQFNGSAINLHLTFNENAGHQSWESDAAAPLTVARHQVEPIWQRLDRRATQQGYAPVSKPEVTNDPSLCLITQKGERLQPVDVKGNIYSFYVPANVRVVAMHSKAALPSEVVGPYLDDRRMLGVLVAKINVFGDRNLTILPADMTGLSGWHPAELNRADRWTKGLATLPEAVAEVSTKVKLIKVELTATSEYFVDMIEIAEKIA